MDLKALHQFHTVVLTLTMEFIHRIRLLSGAEADCRVLLAWLLFSVVLAGCQPEDPPATASPPSGASDELEIRSETVATAPGLDEASRQFVGPLADAYQRIDPLKDGWESEAFSEEATLRLKSLAKSIGDPVKLRKGELAQVFAPGAVLSILPGAFREVYRDEVFLVRRAQLPADADTLPPDKAFQSLLADLASSDYIQTGVKLFKVEPQSDEVVTRVYFHAAGTSTGGRKQINTEWICRWTPDMKTPLLKSIQLLTYEDAVRLGHNGNPLFGDATESVFKGSPVYKEQLLKSTDHWRSQLSRNLGLDVVANHGLALGDVNGDELEDVYLCQQGGLPNRLFLRQPDGTLRDYTDESQTGWLDYCSSALIIDVDNDGDHDLVISQDFKLLLMQNDGSAHFKLIDVIPTHAQTFSLAAADFDMDGDLDLFACGYNPSSDRERTGAMGEPMPYHDAQNGGANIFLENLGSWKFSDATARVGLDHNNNRFSFACAWIDFDQDGDLDLYVANDYGRNNLYQNSDGHFSDVASQLGVEDMSAGMSTSWADVNHDGAYDLYVSNMFSAAGNRITFQRQFKPEIPGDFKSLYQRHARGNSLFLGHPQGGAFTDVTEEMGVSMGRWAWGSRFTDLNNDGWEDIVVANGFISTPDTTDL